MSSPDTSLNQSSTDELKLVIKAANQKYEDFIVQDFELSWTVKQLKLHLNEKYPQKPESSSIRLIYSGKMLHDHWALSECIRHSSETKSHIIHLVYSAIGKQSETKSTPRNISTASEDMDLDNELTPDSSSISTSSSSSSFSTSTRIFTHVATTSSINTQTIGQDTQNENNINFEQQQQHNGRQRFTLTTPKQDFDQIHCDYIRYYESMGVSIQDNAWYSTYIQHLALYKHMYDKFMQSSQMPGSYPITSDFINPITTNPTNRASLPQTRPVNLNETHEFLENPQGGEVLAQVAAREQQAAPPQNRAAAAPNPAPQPEAEREDDWLSLLHNAVSFLVLFSIIYYYSSLERFLIIFTIVVILIIYHNGWFSLQRRQINPRPEPPAAQPAQANNDPREDNQANAENQNNATETITIEQHQQNQPERNTPNSFRVFVSFVLTFFTSLIPERPRIAN